MNTIFTNYIHNEYYLKYLYTTKIIYYIEHNLKTYITIYTQIKHHLI